MPTIAEIRQKYPQYQDMSDEALADALHRKYYSDMPQEQFLQKIGMAPPQAEQPQTLQQDAPKAGSKGFHTAVFAPFKKDLATGEFSFAVPSFLSGLADSAASAVTLPGRVYRGETPVMGPDGHVAPSIIPEALNAASWMTPGSPAQIVKGAAPAPGLTEGQAAAVAAERLGIKLPRAVASDSAIVQQTGKLSSNVPIAGSPLRKASQEAISGLDEAAVAAQKGYGTGDVANAGSMARDALSNFATKAIPEKVGARYDVVDNLVTPNVVTPLKATGETAASILAKRQNAHMTGSSRAVNLVQKALAAKDGLNYEGIKTLRTSIGEFLDDPAKLAQSGMSEGELKSIYRSLTDDLKNSVVRSGGEKALAAFEDANAFAAMTSKQREILNRVVGKQTSDEGLVSKIAAMAGSNSRADLKNLALVRNAVGNDVWSEVSSTIVSKLGRAKDGTFSPDRFLTEYGKLSKTGKAMLFKVEGKEGLAQSLDDIAAVSARFKQLNQYANPSGTGQAVGFMGAGALGPVAALKVGVPTYLLSRVLAKPVSAKALAQYAKAYEIAAKKPSSGSSAFLAKQAQKLALIVANEAGEPGMATRLIGHLSSVQKAAADNPENQKAGRPEAQPQADNPQERFNRAYLAGNAA